MLGIVLTLILTLGAGALALALFDLVVTRGGRLGRAAFSVGLGVASFLLALHGDVGMAAVTVTAILAGSNTYIADIIATADGDTAATITHGLAASPKEISFCNLLSFALTALPAWAFTAPGATTSTGTKLASTGSGNAGAQVRVTIKTPHSIGA